MLRLANAKAIENQLTGGREGRLLRLAELICTISDHTKVEGLRRVRARAYSRTFIPPPSVIDLNTLMACVVWQVWPESDLLVRVPTEKIQVNEVCL